MLKNVYFVLGKWASLGYFCGGFIITQKKMNLEQSTSYLAALLHQMGLGLMNASVFQEKHITT